MKKLFTLIFALAIFVGTVSSADVFLRCNLNATQDNNWYSWDNDVADYKFTFVSNNGTEDVYTYTINASQWTGDINFRLHNSGWGTTQQIPYQGQSTVWDFSTYLQATYEIKANEYDYKSENYPNKYFTINHAKARGSEYKITLYWRTSDNRIWMSVDLISVPVTIGSAGYATFSSAYDVDFTDVSDVAAYRAVQTSNNEVLLKKVSGKVPAATGLVLKGTANTNPTIPTTIGATDIGDNNMVATVQDTPISIGSLDGAYYYFLAGTDAQSVGFYRLEMGEYTSKAGKAYYKATTHDLAQTNSRAAWIFEDETLGVNTIESTQNADVIYDLQGRVAKTAKAGLYIKNGKKVFMK